MDNDKFDCNLQAQKQTDYNPDKSLTEGALVGMSWAARARGRRSARRRARSRLVGTGASTGATPAGPWALGGAYLYDKNLNRLSAPTTRASRRAATR